MRRLNLAHEILSPPVGSKQFHDRGAFAAAVLLRELVEQGAGLIVEGDL